MDNERVIVTGQPRTGKTTLVKSWLTKMPRKIIIDTVGDDYYEGFVTSDPAELVTYWNRVAGGDEWAITVKGDSREVRDAAMRLLVRKSRAKTVKPYWCIVEEPGNRFCRPNWLHDDFGELMSSGGHWGVSFIITTQVFSQVSRVMSSHIDTIVAFKVDEPLYLQDLAKRGFDPDVVSRLEKFQYVYNRPCSLMGS